MSGICKNFGPTRALDQVDLTLIQGEIHAVIGENGAGKSTLMNVLSGAVAADSGQIELFGKPLVPANPMDSRRAGVAMIYQETGAGSPPDCGRECAAGDRAGSRAAAGPEYEPEEGRGVFESSRALG